MAIEIKKENGETKLYEQVHERLKKFRDDCPVSQGWAIITEVLNSDNMRVAVVAKILDPKGSVVATGHAEELRNDNDVNRSSAMENGETSAVGRALFLAGYGNGEVCSAEELAAALRTQSQMRGRKITPVDSNAAPQGGKGQRANDRPAHQKPEPKNAPKGQPVPSKAPAGRSGCFEGVNPKVVDLLANMGVDTNAMAVFDLNVHFDGNVIKISGAQTKEAKHLWARKSFRWDGQAWWRKAA